MSEIDLSLRAAPGGRLPARAARGAAGGPRARWAPWRSAALHLGGLGGLALALGLLARSPLAVLLVPLHGQTLEQWAPVVIRFLLGRLGGAGKFRSQRAQLGHVVALPGGALDPQAPAGALVASRRSSRTSSCSRPSSCATNTPASARPRTGGRGRSPRRCASAPGLSPCSGPAEREQRLADYGAVLASLARDDCAAAPGRLDRAHAPRRRRRARRLPARGQARRREPRGAARGAHLLPAADRPRRRRRRGARADLRASDRRAAPGRPARDRADGRRGPRRARGARLRRSGS